jgi:hypothetical protein
MNVHPKVVPSILEVESRPISTAWTLETTAVTISTSQSAIMGKLKAAVANVRAAK